MYVVIFAATFLLNACTVEADITVHSAWLRPVAQGDNGAVYFVLNNQSAEADELVGASSNSAEAVEIHESSMTADTQVMQMKRAFSVPLERGAEVVFEPGGYHLMLVHMNQELAIGERIEVTLHFKNHEDIPVSVSVAEVAPAGNEHDH